MVEEKQEKMNSRNKILKSLKLNTIEEYPEPDLDTLFAKAIVFDKPLEKFKESLAKAGGKFMMLPEGMSVEECAASQFDSTYTIIKGGVAVAENGAVWVMQQKEDRSEYFLPEALAIIIDKENIVNNMHEASSMIDTGDYGYGVFMSGPSKTADIESALVIGAHGPRKLVVICK